MADGHPHWTCPRAAICIIQFDFHIEAICHVGCVGGQSLRGESQFGAAYFEIRRFFATGVNGSADPIIRSNRSARGGR